MIPSWLTWLMEAKIRPVSPPVEIESAWLCSRASSLNIPPSKSANGNWTGIGPRKYILDILFSKDNIGSSCFVSLISHPHPGLLVGTFRKEENIRRSDMGIITYGHACLSTSAGLYQYHSVCCTRPIDRCRGCIFKYRDRLDILRFDGSKRLFNPVNQNQGIRIVQGSRSPNTDIRRLLTWLPSLILDRQPRTQTLQAERRIGHRPLLEFSCRDRTHGSGHVSSALSSKTDNHHLIHQSNIGTHGNIQTFIEVCLGQLDHLCLIADI